MTTSRFRRFTPDELDPEQRVLYDAIAGGPRATGPFPLTDDQGALTGPFNAMLLAPGIGTALQELGAALRFRGALGARQREIAILVVAVAFDSAFERFAHEAVGRTIGMTDADFEAIRDEQYYAFEGNERVVAETAAALASRRTLTEAETDRIVAALGAAVLYELTTLVGYYATLALQLRVFGDELPT